MAPLCHTFFPPFSPLTSKTAAYLDPLTSERLMGPPENMKLDRAREIYAKIQFLPLFSSIIHSISLKICNIRRIRQFLKIHGVGVFSVLCILFVFLYYCKKIHIYHENMHFHQNTQFNKNAYFPILACYAPRIFQFLRVNPGNNHIFGSVEFRTTNGTPRKYENRQGTRNGCKNQVFTPIFLQIFMEANWKWSYIYMGLTAVICPKLTNSCYLCGFSIIRVYKV